MKTYDVVVIGGGASGIMSAISAKKKYPHYSVAIIDRTFSIGRKILVSGAGRCNITNVNLKVNYQNHYYSSSPELISSVFQQFGYTEIIDFFDDLGIGLYVEQKADLGKVFPQTNQAQTVVTLLEDELQSLNVDVFLNAEVLSVQKKNDEFLVNVGKVSNKVEGQKKITPEEISAKYVILSAGGKTYPALGSNGTGYALAKSFGHKIIEAVPAAVPLEAKNELSQKLQGVKMKVTATSEIEGKKVKSVTDDIIFTKYGLSGPSIMNLSRDVSIQINRKNEDQVYISLNFLPGMDVNELEQLLTLRWRKRPTQTLEKSLLGLFPYKFPQAFLICIGCDPGQKVGDLKEERFKNLVGRLTSYKIKVTATRGWNEGEFTAGGIDATEVKVGTLESKLVDNLFFCGEILDVDGDIGGFNLSWAWSSGWVAGKLAENKHG